MKKLVPILKYCAQFSPQNPGIYDGWTFILCFLINCNIFQSHLNRKHRDATVQNVKKNFLQPARAVEFHPPLLDPIGQDGDGGGHDGDGSQGGDGGQESDGGDQDDYGTSDASIDDDGRSVGEQDIAEDVSYSQLR